jgi:iron complex transport system permease protein
MISFTLAFPLSRAMDSLTLGESTALSLGLSLAPVRSMLIFSLTLATGKAVAQTGLIAFVGLAAPHLVRSLVKTKHNWVVFLSVLIGVALMLSADLMARHLLAPQELLVGVLMAVLDGSYLLWHLYSNQTMRSAR